MKYKCNNCGKEFKPPRYYWKGLAGEYCSPKCAAFGCPNALLIKDEI